MSGSRDSGSSATSSPNDLRCHVAFLRPEPMKNVLSGRKTCESRLSVRPHLARNARVNDWLIFKCRDCFAASRITAIDTYDHLGQSDVLALMETYRESVGAGNPDAGYWQQKATSCHHAIMLHFGPVVRLPAFRVPTRMYAWIDDYTAALPPEIAALLAGDVRYP